MNKPINNPSLKYETEKHIANMKQGTSNILVSVRVRPLLPKEKAINSFETVKVLDQQLVSLEDPEKENNLDAISRKNRDKTNQWAFDYAFDQYTSQKQIFDCTTSFLIDGLIDGFNCTVFAYGATGAGKTYTMVGTPDDPGIMQRTLNQLYLLVEKQKKTKQSTIKASYLEIYNENIKDLLTQEDKNLELREDPVQGVNVINLSEVNVDSTQEIMNLLKTGNKNRTMEATGANEVSSRSHAVLLISLEVQEKNQGINQQIQQSKLCMVDLAGSERAAKTNNRGIRLIEGAKINQSLLTLGNCIQALAEQQEKSNQNLFVPYRGSKLTRLLKDSLGGNCRTVMISNVSPCIDQVEDTYNTLVYAHRAKIIKTNVQRNVVNVEKHISNYTNIIDGLRKENEALKKIMIEKDKINTELGNLPEQGQGRQMNQLVHDNKSRVLVTKYEKELTTHYLEEIEALKSIYELEEKIEIGQYGVFRNLTQLSQLNNKVGAEASVLKEKVQNQKYQIEKFEKDREELKKQYKKLKDLRNGKIAYIKQQDMASSKLGFLLGVYKQGQLMVENQEIHFKEKLVETQSNQKELQIAFLHNQMVARDSVINQQKELLKENKIKSNIQYNYIKNMKEISEEAKLNFPLVNKNMDLIYGNGGQHKNNHSQPQNSNNNRSRVYNNKNSLSQKYLPNNNNYSFVNNNNSNVNKYNQNQMKNQQQFQQQYNQQQNNNRNNMLNGNSNRSSVLKDDFYNEMEVLDNKSIFQNNSKNVLNQGNQQQQQQQQYDDNFSNYSNSNKNFDNNVNQRINIQQQQQEQFQEYDESIENNQNFESNLSNIGKNNDVYHYKKDFQEHKKNQKDFLNDHKYTNQRDHEELKKYNDEKKEKRIQQLLDNNNENNLDVSFDLQQNNGIPHSTKPQRKKLIYRDGKVIRDDQYLIDMDKKAQKYKENQMSSQQRQEKFLLEFRKKQKDQRQKKIYGEERQYSHSNLPSSQYQVQVYNKERQTGVKKRSHHNEQKNVILQNLNNDAMMNNSFDSNNVYIPGQQNTKEIIKQLEGKQYLAPKRSNLKNKMNLDTVLDDKKRIDPLQKDRIQGQVNLNRHYKESPYVKSFEKKSLDNQIKYDNIRQMNINTDHLDNKHNNNNQEQPKKPQKYNKFAEYQKQKRIAPPQKMPVNKNNNNNMYEDMNANILNNNNSGNLTGMNSEQY